MSKTRHILGISGGKDSSALAIYLKDKVPEMEYVFCDTGSELKETYDFIKRLEAHLDKKVIRLPKELEGYSSNYDFNHVLDLFGNYLPSPQARWCTKKLKLEPFEKYIGDDDVINYVGIRYDENREGYISQKETIKPVFPFVEDGVTRRDVFDILDKSVGVPEYYKWRSRSGCYFCFFQRQDEWLGLKRNHPELFQKAKDIEITSGDGFTWVNGRNLDEVVEHAEKREKERGVIASDKSSKLDRWQELLAQEEDEEDDNDKACLICTL